MAITQRQIKSAVTDDIRSTLSDLVERLVTFGERSARLRLFVESRDQLPPEVTTLLDLSKRKELQHIEHVRKTLDGIPEHPKDRPLHDFSKDELYFFSTSAKFDYRIDSPATEKLFRIETERHYSLEPHHEQFERIQNRECDVDDIREMAIDRMSRNIQANQGLVDMEQMTKYVPNFPLGDNRKKQDIFKDFLTTNRIPTEETYWDMFRSDG